MAWMEYSSPAPVSASASSHCSADQDRHSALLRGVLLGEVAEEDPVAVVPHAAEPVHRLARALEGALGEVLDVVVDAVVDLVLGPGGRGLQEPSVLGVVVGVLGGVEDLVGGRHLEVLQGGVGGELGVVVVEGAVGEDRVVARDERGIGGAVAVEAVVAEVLEVDVELGVATEGAVGQGCPVAGRHVGVDHAVGDAPASST